ncbi:MAG: hypothetical protein ACXVIU_00195 [Halobacteriota archaeon]
MYGGKQSMTSRKLQAVLAVAIVAAVLTSGCLSSLTSRSPPTATPQDLSASYDASFVLSGWRAINKFTQVTPKTYVGTYTDEKGQSWNFTVQLFSAENTSYSRYFELMKKKSDEGYVKTNESKIALGTGQTVFGRIDERWYGYKASDSGNPALYALLFGYDENAASWVVATVASGAIVTTKTTTALS